MKVRASATELVIDFGCLFPDPGTTAPNEFEPIVRVVMAIQAAQPLADMLGKAYAAHDEAVQARITEEVKKANDAARRTAM